MRLPPSWVTACVGCMLAGVGIDAVRATPRGPAPAPRAPTPSSGVLIPQLRSYLPPATPSRPVQAAMLLQLADCSGNLRVLHLLHRKPVRAQIALAVIWYVGPTSDSTALRARLPAWTRRVPLVPASPTVLADLATLGVRTSPWLVMLDHDDRLRLSTGAPRSSREVAGLQRTIEGLTWTEGL